MVGGQVTVALSESYIPLKGLHTETVHILLVILLIIPRYIHMEYSNCLGLLFQIADNQFLDVTGTIED